MSGFKSDYLSSALLDQVFGGTALTPAATLYCGLSTTTINSDGTGITEPSGGSYARVPVTNNPTNFPAASSKTKHCAIDIIFPTASGSWGTPTWAFWSDAASSGHMLDAGPITSPIAISSGMQFRFPATTGFTGTEA